VLELSSREALQLGHPYIGTEHLLLGIIRQGEGTAARVLVSVAVDLNQLRQEVIRLLPESTEGDVAVRRQVTSNENHTLIGSTMNGVTLEGEVVPLSV
jgi:ATP-dependent Clp protease ATP-binding subunit ClpC